MKVKFIYELNDKAAVLLTFIAQKHLIASLTFGSMKG